MFDDLDHLEEEAIYILREVYGQFANPVILFSGGKDSIVVTHLAIRAFAPMPLPFPLLHVDTGHNFPETIAFRDHFVQKNNARLIVRLVQDTIDQGRAVEETGPRASRNAIQSVTLMDAIRDLKIDCAIGGARRDEEKSRAKERAISCRNSAGQWDPKAQRPEFGRHLNCAHSAGEHFRAFPLSNWTERDVWSYIVRRNLPVPDLYFSHTRLVFEREGVLYAVTDFLQPDGDELATERVVRFRTVGDATCTGAILSTASNLADILDEISTLRTTERSGRGDDKRSDTAMEDRKKQGYF
ncbi:MAG: sulfate adenylyltransferase subunit 2 [Armatimonadetes bacterium]|nr:sulfate adenylyltransferase subunit 2 [Armatimonadota bacterium]